MKWLVVAAVSLSFCSTAPCSSNWPALWRSVGGRDTGRSLCLRPTPLMYHEHILMQWHRHSNRSLEALRLFWEWTVLNILQTESQFSSRWKCARSLGLLVLSLCIYVWHMKKHNTPSFSLSLCLLNRWKRFKRFCFLQFPAAAERPLNVETESNEAQQSINYLDKWETHY